MRMIDSRLVAIAVCAALAAQFALPPRALGADAPPASVNLEQEFDFDIPAQPLNTALVAFSRQSGVQVVTSSKDVEGLTSPFLKGRFSIREAANRLLHGTGLALRPTRDGTVVIARRDNVSETEGTSTRKVEEIVVTARNPQPTLVQGAISRSPDSVLPFQVITRQQLLESGVTTAMELARNLPQNTAMGTPSQNVTNHQGTRDVESLNLRGFGIGRTLMLLNDRRLAVRDGNQANSVAIPIAAVDRVEILSGAASGIYGASALGGVVNYILRNDYQGTELALYGAGSTHGEAQDQRATFLAGRDLLGGRMNLLVAAEAGKQGKLLMSDRGYINEVFARRLALNPTSLISGPLVPDMPANIRVTTGTLGIPGSSATFASVPNGYDGVNRGTSTFASTAGVFNLARNAGAGSNESVIRAATHDEKIFGQAIYALTPRIAGFVEASFAKATRPKDASTTTGFTFTVPAANPFNPFGRSVSVAFVPVDVGSTTENYDDTQRYVTGFKGALGATWRWSTDFVYSRDFTHAVTTSPSFAAVSSALASSNPATAYNPFADLRTQHPNSQTLLDSLRTFLESDFNLHSRVLAARAAGNAFDLPAGPLRISVGAEKRTEASTQIARVPGREIFQPYVARHVSAEYGEAVAPAISPEMHVPFVHALEFSGAVRSERYKDSISSTNPVYGIKYAPVDGATLRASYTSGYAAPSVSLITENATPIVAVLPGVLTDPRRGNELINDAQERVGGNPDLKAEKAYYKSIGVVFTPNGLPDLRMSVDYYSMRKTDAIIGTLTETQVLQNEAFFPGRVVRANPAPGDPAGFPGRVTLLDIRPINAARLTAKGIDLSADYSMSIGSAGRLGFSAVATHAREYRQQILPTSPDADLVGRPQLGDGAPLRWKGNASVRWSRGGDYASLTIRYLNGYVPTDPLIEGSEIPRSVEVDLYASHAFEAREGVLAGTQIAIGVVNLFDKRPPFAIANGYSLYNDPRQRVVFVRLTKRF